MLILNYHAKFCSATKRRTRGSDKIFNAMKRRRLQDKNILRRSLRPLKNIMSEINTKAGHIKILSRLVRANLTLLLKIHLHQSMFLQFAHCCAPANYLVNIFHYAAWHQGQALHLQRLHA
jgi:hypothetical protein